MPKKYDTVVDGNFPNDWYSASVFSKLIGHKLSNGSRVDLYLCCRLNFAADVIQTHTPQFMNLGLLTINALDESSVIHTPVTIILRPTDGSHRIVQDHVFGERAAVGISEKNSDHDYSCLSVCL